jgi:hypothetical protein
MKKDLRYNVDKNFLKGKKYPMSYQLFICHALKKKESDHDEAESLLSAMMTCMQEGESFYKKNFLEMVPSLFGFHQGFVVTDRTKSCSPLVLYPVQYNPSNHGDRCTAFYLSLQNVAQNLDKIMPILLNPSNSEWDDTIQEKLASTINHV